MNTLLRHVRRSASLICAGAALTIPGIRAAADDAPAQADAFPTFDSYIKVTGQDASVTGDKSSFASHNGTPATGAVGIEDLFYSKDLNDTTTATVNGHALEGTDDYLGTFDLSKDGIGSLEVGYKRFRTFYDGVGGFFPLADQFQAFDPESLHVDRSSFWATLKLAKDTGPSFTFTFRDEIRTGMKDSSEWAPEINPDAVIKAGVITGTAVPANTPYIAPNVLLLDEHHDIVQGAMTDKVGATTEILTASINTVNNNDSRDYVRYPNSTVIADPTVTVQDDQELTRSTSFQVINQTETKASSKVGIDTGLTYLHLTSADGGSWITPSYSSTANAIYATNTATGIYGGSKFDDYVGNVSLKLTPTQDWLAELAFRDEANVTSSAGGFTTTSLSATAKTVTAANITTSDDVTYSHYVDHVATPEFNLQYLGFDRLSFYFTYDDRLDRDHQHWINPFADITIPGTGATTMAAASLANTFFQDANETDQDVKVGANWNASNQFTFRAEVFRKDHQNDFVGSNDIIGTASYGALYVNGYTFTGVKLSVIIKPLPELTFSTRYQPQYGMMSVTGNTVTGGSNNEVTSGKASGQLISETVDWAPTTRIYVQGNINVVYNYIQTAYPVVVVSATTNIPTPIQNANNNYITSSGLVGFVLDKLDDIQLQGISTKADNYNPQIAAGGQPYGASFLEDSVTIGLKHKFSDKLIGDCKIGYLHLDDETTGGFTNYRGPLAYISLTYSL